MFKSIITKAEEILNSLFDWHDLLTNFNYSEIIKIGIVILLLITFLIIIRKIVKNIKIKKISSKFPLAIKKYNDTCNMSRYWRKRTRKNMPSFSDGISKWRKFENQLIKEKQEEEKASLISRKYPLGVAKFNRINYVFSSNSFIIANVAKIIQYEKEERLSKFYDTWINSQVEFAQKCRNLRDKVLPDWGCYNYELRFPVKKDKKFEVWQLFKESFSEETDLDYSLYPSVEINAKDKPKLLSNKIHYYEFVYDEILKFLLRLKNEYKDDRVIICQYGNSGITEYKKLNDYHFKYFQNKALHAGGFILRDVSNRKLPTVPIRLNNRANLVIIDVVTSNDNLKNTCQREIDFLNNLALNAINTLNLNYNSFVNIVYITLLKQYDRREMLSILADKEKELERKKKEEREERERQRKAEKASNISRNYSDGFFRFRWDYDGDLTDDIIIANEYKIKRLDYDEKERKKIEEEKRREQKRLEILSSDFKNERIEILQLLRENYIDCFYHFTDRRNIKSIKKNGGLFSWDYLERKDISIPRQGGGNLSRQLDIRYGLQDYVRLSFCPRHPMIYRLEQEGADIVVLRISIDVATFERTLFSNMNATDSGHIHGSTLADLKRVNFFATQRSYVSRTDPLFKYLQAEVMVKTHVPLRFITNIDDF